MIGTGVELPINVNIKELLGEGNAAGDNKLLDVMRDIATDLRGGTEENAENLRGTDLSRLSDNLDELTRVRAVVGATTNRLTTAGTRLEQLEEASLDAAVRRCATPTCRRRSSNSRPSRPPTKRLCARRRR